MAQSRSHFVIPDSPLDSDPESETLSDASDQSLADNSNSLGEAAGSTSSIIKVLVIQENLERFQDLRHLLPPTHSCDFEFQCAHDLETASERLDSERWDLIFVDLDTSAGNAQEAFKRIVQFSAEHPLIVLTPMEHEHVARQAIRQGAQDYIIYEEAIPQLLHRTIWAAIDRFNLNRELQAKTKQVERAFWQKHQFLSTLSHEIKTPMNGIRGGMQLLREDSKDPEQTESIDMIDGAINQLMVLIDNLLEHGKAESGKVIIRRVPTHLENLIETLKYTFQMACEVKGLQLSFTVHENVPKVPIIDELRLRQILSNLIGNAIKFSDSGSIDISIQSESEQALRFDVKDTGRGISKDKQKRIFQPYDQGDDLSDIRTQGTGLGLAICKEYVEAMAGNIQVSSKPGEGSTFTFTISTES
ncbi:MAG: ATP-binding protein [Verrucomicrobiota bacterium]